MELENLNELTEKLKELGKETLRYKIFTQYFPSIPEDEIFEYSLIVPEKHIDTLGEAGETLKNESWVAVTKYADEFTAIKNEFLAGSLVELENGFNG